LPSDKCRPAEDRYQGMMWITQIKALAEECEMIIIYFPSGLE